jgi:DNA-binding NtrC family response regulator
MQPEPKPNTDDNTTSATLSSSPYILVVDDEPDIRELLREILEDEGFVVDTAENAAAAREAHRHRRPDLVLLDIWMPDIDGISLLKEWSVDGRPPMPVIMMSGHGTVETAVEATRLGAYDFIEKPLSLAKLLLTIEHALEADKLARENRGLRALNDTVSEPIGKSVVMQRLKEQLRRIAEHETWVLMIGEPGSGQRIFARYLHANSPQHDRPFFEVHAGSLNGEHAQEELFGVETRDGKIRYGILEQVNGGTLYLNEIAEMPDPVQASLFSALESSQFYRVGGKQPVALNVRIIADTSQDLEQLVTTGRFRQDLFYLLNVVPLPIPPLRDHREDVPELLSFFTNLYVNKENLPYRHFTVAAQNRLRNYDWPGNIRELCNLVQRLLIVGSGTEIDVDEVDGTLGAQQHMFDTGGFRAGFDLPLRDARELFERAYFEYQLDKTGGSVGKVAELSGLERTHLYRKLKSLGIETKKRVKDK